MRELLFGGALAVLYVTAYAAAVWYQLISIPSARLVYFVLAILSTLIALQERREIFAFVAVATGFATPFILTAPVGSMTVLSLYLAAMTGMGLTIYLMRGWPSIVWITFVAFWLGIAGATNYGGELSAGHRSVAPHRSSRSGYHGFRSSSHVPTGTAAARLRSIYALSTQPWTDATDGRARFPGGGDWRREERAGQPRPVGVAAAQSDPGCRFSAGYLADRGLGRSGVWDWYCLEPVHSRLLAAVPSRMRKSRMSSRPRPFCGRCWVSCASQRHPNGFRSPHSLRRSSSCRRCALTPGLAR